MGPARSSREYRCASLIVSVASPGLMTTTLQPSRSTSAPEPIVEGRQPPGETALIAVFTIGPLLALLAAVPFAWGWGLGWTDVALAVVFYGVTGLGVTVGFHRHFTHRAFKAIRPLRIALAVAGSFAMQGSVIEWVADHRRHHAYSDKEGDPHSPRLFGTGPVALVRGFGHAHMGWLFGRDVTNARRFAPDLQANRDVRRVDRLFPLWAVATLVLPTVLGGLLTWSWWGALTGFAAPSGPGDTRIPRRDVTGRRADGDSHRLRCGRWLGPADGGMFPSLLRGER